MAGFKKSSRSNCQSRSDSASCGGRSTDGADSTSSGPTRRMLIKPLSTVGDRGKPTNSIGRDLQRVVNFIEDERHLVAFDLYLDCKERLKDLREEKKKHDEKVSARSGRGRERTKRTWLPQKKGVKEDAFDVEGFETAIGLARKYEDEFTVLEKRAPLFQSCRDNMDESEEWTLAQTLFGVTTFYRREKDGSLSIKLEGELKGIPLFEQVCVLREIDLHCHWAPFVTSSLTVAHIDKLDTIGWFMLGLPRFGLARDSCFRAVGCDCVEEDQSVLIVGRGVEDRVDPDAPVDEGTRFLSDDPDLETLDIPPKPTRMGSGRLTMKMFEAKIRVLGPDHCHTYILANIDPNLAFIPQSLLEFVMKKMCGFLLNKLQGAAKKISKDPVRNVHAQRMRDESAFYRDWLLPKFRNIAADRGWDVPTIAAFELSEAQQVEADKILQRRGGEMHSFSQFDSGAGSNNDVNSTRSTPNLYHSKPLDGKDDDNNSDISSLSGTSQSIWKNNPIAQYLREIESKTQARKDKAAQESRRKAAARLRPRPLPVDKKERLRELKTHKEKKLRGRSFPSSGSMDGSLAPVHEDSSVETNMTRGVPYSPISEALDGQGRCRRFWVVSSLVLLLFILLHGDRFLPTFSSLGGEMLSAFSRDAVTLVYMCLCGVVHFLLCDVELIYAFEAFEMGMKTGKQVKTFYRGQVRLVVAAASGFLVAISVGKAVLLAWLKAAIVWLFYLYRHGMDKYFNSPNEQAAIEADSALDAVVDDTQELNPTIVSMVPAMLYDGYSAITGVTYAIFNWQMKVFVRSNFIGRSLESLTTGIYNTWVGLLSGIGASFYSLATSDDIQDSPGYSWRDDAIATLRVLLTYTAVFLLAILAFLNILSKSYRYKKPNPDSPSKQSVAATSTSGSSGNHNGVLPPKRAVAPAKSMDSSTARHRLKFRRKRKEKQEDDSD